MAGSRTIAAGGGPEQLSSGRRWRLAILASHPIQYFAPWFRHLATRCDLEVLYACQQDAQGQGAAGFGVNFEWDVPLLGGYRYRWLKNVSSQPGLRTFGGCDTPELFDLIRPENYDALLVIGWRLKSSIQGMRAARRHRVPVFCRGDSHLGTRRSALKRALKYPLYRWFLPRLDAHLYVGTRNLEYLRHYGVREEQLFFCPHFVDNDFFATRAEEARHNGATAAIRQRFGIPGDACVALFAGKFIPVKRPLDFLQGCLSAAGQRNGFHAILVGDGPMRAVIEAQAAVHPQQIHLAGFRNQRDMPAIYAAADVLVLPGEETWGLVVNEAFACGLPAIVSDAVGCAPDLIEDGATGATYPLGEVSALAARLVQFRGADPLAVGRKSATNSIDRATAGLERALATFVHG